MATTSICRSSFRSLVALSLAACAAASSCIRDVYEIGIAVFRLARTWLMSVPASVSPVERNAMDLVKPPQYLKGQAARAKASQRSQTEPCRKFSAWSLCPSI